MQHLERGRDGRNQFWRYLVITLVAFIGGQFLGAIPLIVLIRRMAMENPGMNIDVETIGDPARLGVSSNVSLVLLLLPFVVSLILMVVLLKPLHKRNLAEVINGTKRIRWGRFFYAAGLWVMIQIVVLGIGLAIDPGNFAFRFNAATFFPLLLVSLLIIPLQTSFEELYFRGYIAQGIGAGTRSRWAAILIPGIAFGLMHIANPEIKAYGLLFTLPQYLLFGIVFGIISTLDDGIECTLGAHAINNIFASTMVTFKASALPTDALFEQKVVDPRMDLLYFAIACVIFVLLLKKRYGWDFRTLRQGVVEREIAAGQHEISSDRP